MRYALAFALLAAPAVADYKDFEAGVIFSERPCHEALAAIDGEYGFDVMGQAWAIILAHDEENGGMFATEEKTLETLRIACAQSPETPAIELLEGLK